MSEIDTAALRAAAEAATPGPWRCAEQTHGEWYGIQSQFFALGNVFLAKDGAHIAAASPDVVLTLLDEVEALRTLQERVARLAVEYDEYLAILVSIGARPGNQNEVHDAALAADQLWEALEGSPSTAKERWALGSDTHPQGPQIDAQERS